MIVSVRVSLHTLLDVETLARKPEARDTCAQRDLARAGTALLGEHLYVRSHVGANVDLQP